ncbi:hypothetical protein P3342_009701 [Pyrenophora teres f. teres]|nr:hypothetical protein P3342_009701 [Pyrenophora teres f. teres]
MTGSNYDNEVGCCRDEAAGPITPPVIQSNWQGLVMHMRSAHMSNRPSETRIAPHGLNHCRAVAGFCPIHTLVIVMDWQKNHFTNT